MRGSTAGLPEDFQNNGTTYYTLLTVLDSLFSFFILCPCVVGYWRSVWTLMDIYVTPENPLLSAVISTALGITGHLLFALFQKIFERHLHPDKNRIIFYLISRIYTVCFAFTCVNGWRGPWAILTVQTKTNVRSLVVTTSVGLVALISLRALRNVSAPPCVVVSDVTKGYFEVLTMFRVSISEKTSIYILDCLFSVLVVGTLVVFVWRGLWVLVDVLLFPEDEIWSAWGSLDWPCRATPEHNAVTDVLGYTIIAIVFLLQPLMRIVSTKLSGAPRLLAADIFIVTSLIGTINVWRGIWNLLDLYFLPENLELSCWIVHWISIILLILLGCSNSLLVRGVYIDAEEPEGKCVVFPCYYLRMIFQKEKLKKLNKQKLQMNENNEKIVMENNHVITVTTISDKVEGSYNREHC